jgi:hypothetical protein
MEILKTNPSMHLVTLKLHMHGANIYLIDGYFNNTIQHLYKDFDILMYMENGCIFGALEPMQYTSGEHRPVKKDLSKFGKMQNMFIETGHG